MFGCRGGGQDEPNELEKKHTSFSGMKDGSYLVFAGSISMFIDFLLGGGLSRRDFCIIDECFQASLRQIDVFFREFSFKHPKVQATEVCNVAPPVCLWNFIDLYIAMIRVIWGETTTSYGFFQLKTNGCNRQKPAGSFKKPSVVDASGKPATSPNGFFLWDFAETASFSIFTKLFQNGVFPVAKISAYSKLFIGKVVFSQYFSRCLERFPNLQQKNRRKPIYKKHVYVVGIYYNLLVLISTQF